MNEIYTVALLSDFRGDISGTVTKKRWVELSFKANCAFLWHWHHTQG